MGKPERTNKEKSEDLWKAIEILQERVDKLEEKIKWLTPTT